MWDILLEDFNKMLDIWYKKVKEINNFSCLYDDIDWVLWDILLEDYLLLFN